MDKQLRDDNYNHFIKNKSNFIETDVSLKITDKTFSSAGLNPFIRHNSSPRGIMASMQIAQAVSLTDGKPNMIQSGVDYELGKFAVTREIEQNSEVIAVIHRQLRYDDVSTRMESLLIYRNLETGELDCIDLPKYSKLHPHFGHELVNTDKIDTYVKGDIIQANTILSKPKTLKDDGSYSLGRDVNMLLMSLTENDEDGYVISESLAKDFKFKLFETRVIEVDEDEFLLDLNEDINGEYKPFMGIGETVRPDGIIFGKRKYTPEYGPAILSRKELKQFNPIFDEIVYGRSGYVGKVIDVKVYTNNKRKRKLPIGTDDMLKEYSEALINFYKQIINIYDSVNKEHYNTLGTNIPVGNNLSTLLVEAYGIVESASPNSKLKKIHKLKQLSLYRIEVEIEYTIDKLTYGYKLSDLSGNKGVVVSVVPDEDMPVDKMGNRADIIGDIKSTPSRLNVGRLYEQYIKGSMLTVTRLVKDKLKELNYKTIDEVTDIDVKELFKIPMEFIEIFDNVLYKLYQDAYNSNDIYSMKDVLSNILNDNFMIYISPASEKEFYTIIEELKRSKFKPFKDTLTFNYRGKKVTTKEAITIAPMYVVLLSKIADDILTTASAYVNHSGFPVVVSKRSKHSLPFTNSPTRTIGETEARIIAAFGGVELLAELRDINSSIESHKEVYKNILLADKPTNIDRVIDRDKIPYGNDRGSIILDTLYKSVGMELKYVEDSSDFVDTDRVEEDILLSIDDMEDVEEIG